MNTDKNGLRKVVNRLFRYETMSGFGACPVYMERWTLARGFDCAVYLHHFTGDDWSRDPHDHPRRFISIGLKGWYYEDVFDRTGQLINTTKYQAPWLRSFPPEHVHRIRAAENNGATWTLVIVLPKRRDWGFIREGKWIPFKEYVFGGKARKNC